MNSEIKTIIQDYEQQKESFFDFYYTMKRRKEFIYTLKLKKEITFNICDFYRNNMILPPIFSFF